MFFVDLQTMPEMILFSHFGVIAKSLSLKIKVKNITVLYTDRRDERWEGVAWTGEWQTTCGWASGEKSGCQMCEIAGNRACEWAGG